MITRLPPSLAGYWMRLELYQQLSRGLASPTQEVQMDFTENLEYEHACTHWCLLDWTCIP